MKTEIDEEENAISRPPNLRIPSQESEVSDERSYFQILLSFIGPGYMIAVGNFDPGNWATDLAAGSKHGYSLLFIILLANFMAMHLQTLCVRLGVVTGLDLAQACRKYYPKPFALFLYVLCELAIIATDLAEVIGSAIALNLLFGIPLLVGVSLTVLDVMVILAFWNGKNLRFFELLIIILVLTTATCLFTIVSYSKPVWKDVFWGYLPSKSIITEPNLIYISVGIIGATVMPHNLYLHSSIVKYRTGSGSKSWGDIDEIENDVETPLIPRTPLQKSRIPKMIQMSWIDSTFALVFALLVNSAILVIAAANFHNNGHNNVADIADAYHLIGDIIGYFYATLFAIGLLLAGQASTITGTLAGQIVMQGFLGSGFKLKPWVRKIITRTLAVLPAIGCVIFFGEARLNDLLIWSQIILSLQLPFALWPLIYLTCNSKIMSMVDGVTSDSYENNEQSMDTDDELLDVSFANSWSVTIVSFVIGILLTVFNVILLIEAGRGNI